MPAAPYRSWLLLLLTACTSVAGPEGSAHNLAAADPSPVHEVDTGRLADGWVAPSEQIAWAQITDFGAAFPDVALMDPRISGDGSTAVMVDRHFDAARGEGVRVLRARLDGGPLQEVDHFVPWASCGARVDTDDAGTRFLTTDGYQLRLADTTGRGGRPLLALFSPRLHTARISGDGAWVFALIDRDSAAARQPALERGLYRMRTDGSDLEQIVGPPAIANLLELGATTRVSPFGGEGSESLSVSTDGDRLAFVVTADGQEQVFTARGDGSGLQRVGNAADAIHGLGADPTGSRIAWTTRSGLTWHTYMAWSDGSGMIKLDRGAPPSSTPTSRIDVGADLMTVLLSGEQRVWQVDTADSWPVGSLAPGQTDCDTRPLASPSMSKDGTRFLFATATDVGWELAVLDRTGDLDGLAPTLDAARSEPFRVLPGKGVTRFELLATAGHSDLAAEAKHIIMREGALGRGGPMYDDGERGGDLRPADQLYTQAGVTWSIAEPSGPRSVRMTVEAHDRLGRRRCTSASFPLVEVE